MIKTIKKILMTIMMIKFNGYGLTKFFKMILIINKNKYVNLLVKNIYYMMKNIQMKLKNFIKLMTSISNSNM
jgi:hypothetical protein